MSEAKGRSRGRSPGEDEEERTPDEAPAAPPRGKARGGGGPAILVTGATDPLPRELIHELYHDPAVRFVMAVSREERPYYFSDFRPSRFRFVQCDILRHRDLESLLRSPHFREAKIDAVAHLAFRRRPATDANEKSKIHRHNVEGTKRLLEAVLEEPLIEKFVYLSSAHVYKLTPDAPVRLDEGSDLEFSPDAPTYVKDRVDADLIVRSAMDNGRVRIVILRSGSIIGRNIDGQLNYLFESFLVAPPLGFDPLINPIHSNDVIKALRLAIERDVQGVYNIAGPDVAPLSEFLRRSGRPRVPLPRTVQGPFWALQRGLGLTHYDPSVAPSYPAFGRLLDIERSREQLGFEPEHHIKFRKLDTEA